MCVFPCGGVGGGTGTVLTSLGGGLVHREEADWPLFLLLLLLPLFKASHHLSSNQISLEEFYFVCQRGASSRERRR